MLTWPGSADATGRRDFKHADVSLWYVEDEEFAKG